MASLTRIRPKVKPAPVKVTRVLFDGMARTRTPHFGRGVLASRPTYRLPVTIEDVAWAERALNDWDEDTVDESRAAEVEAMDRLERGLLL